MVESQEDNIIKFSVYSPVKVDGLENTVATFTLCHSALCFWYLWLLWKVKACDLILSQKLDFQRILLIKILVQSSKQPQSSFLRESKDLMFLYLLESMALFLAVSVIRLA